MRPRNPRSSAEEDLCGLEQLGIESLQLTDCVGQGNPLDLRTSEGDHFSEIARFDCVDGSDAEPSCENAVECRGSPTPLNVSENRHPRLEPRPVLDLSLERDTDASEPDVAERVLLFGPGYLGSTVGGSGALGHDDYREC